MYRLLQCFLVVNRDMHTTKGLLHRIYGVIEVIFYSLNRYKLIEFRA